MKAKLITINNPDGTPAYVTLMPISDEEFESLKPQGRVFDTDDLQTRATFSHGYTVAPNDLQAQLDAAHARIAELEQPEYQLRYQTLTEYEGMLAASEKRIAELEAVCREVVEALEIRHDSNLIRLDFGADNYARVYMPALNVLRRLLDTLPPSE